MTDFEGHLGRECGEHRTTGERAWCGTCQEWCYPRTPCKGCELPKLRAQLEAAHGLICNAHQKRVDDVTTADGASPGWAEAARRWIDNYSESQ